MLTTTVFSQRSLRWFDASPRRATPKGHKTFIIHTAPHKVRPTYIASPSALVAHLNAKLKDDPLSAGVKTPHGPGDGRDAEAAAGSDHDKGVEESQGEGGDEVAELDPWAQYASPDKTPPAWLGAWGPRTWMNAKAQATGRPLLGAEEWDFYTDARVTGVPGDELTPYTLFDLPSVGGEESHLQIVCRTDNHLGVYDREIDWKSPDDTTWLGMDVGEEYAALLSLATGRRIRSGGLTRLFHADDTDPRGAPIRYRHRARTVPTATHLRDRLLPRASDDLDVRDAIDLLSLYPHLTGKNAVQLLRAARQYQLGIWVAEEDPELAWLRLVSAVETMAERYKPEKITHAERLRRYHPTLYAAVEPAGEEVLDAAATAIAGHLGATHKFVRFLADHTPPPPAVRPSAGLQIEWTADAIAQRLKAVYEYRSLALHAGKPLPGPLLTQWENVETAAPPERFDATIGVGNSNWTVDQLPMTLHAFEYLVRNALHARWRKLSEL